MCRRYTEAEVSEIVQQAVQEALHNQLEEINKEKRLTDIEEAIEQLRGDLDALMDDSKKIGF